jgi:N-acetylglucosamine-6-phosphate deacetylase
LSYVDSTPQLLIGGTIVTETEVIQDGWIMIEQGKLKDFGEKGSLPTNHSSYLITNIEHNHFIFPGFIDIHIHGAAGADVMDATEEAISTMAKVLPQEGTTSFLATTITQSDEAISKALSTAASFMKTEYNGAEVLGIHLEGPFISKTYAGAQPVEQIMHPDISLFEKWNQLAEGTIRMVTLAPEEDNGLDFVEFLNKQGIVASIGHSDATHAQVNLAVDRGLSHATHLYNAMRPIHHREPGVVGSVLLDDRIVAEIIFDHVHCAKEMVELAFKMKGSDKLQLITDAMRAKCLRDGFYDLGGQTVKLKGNEARLEDETLAGSVLKMNQAVKHANELEECNLIDLVKISSTNAAKELKVFDRKGSIAVGKDADLVILDQTFNVVRTYCRGHLVYTALRGECYGNTCN